MCNNANTHQTLKSLFYLIWFRNLADLTIHKPYPLLVYDMYYYSWMHDGRNTVD